MQCACAIRKAEFRRIFAPIRRKSLKKLPLDRRRRIFSGFCQTASGQTAERHGMDAVAQYMQQAGHTVVCVILVTVLIFTIWQVYIAFRR